MANKFWSLTLLKDNNNKQYPSVVSDIQQSLITFYQGYDFYNLFGAEAVNYVCGLTTRYSYHTSWWFKESKESKEFKPLSPVILKSLHGYSLWLSIVWLIDGLCDKYRALVTLGDIQVLTDIMLGKTHSSFRVLSLMCDVMRDELRALSNVIVPSNDTTYNGSRVLLLLFDIVQQTYKRYLELMPYNDNKQQLDTWTIKYLDKLLDDTRQNFTLKQYAEWRLNSSAMMCVVWHELLMSPEYRKEDIDDNALKAFELVSLIVSYHNDLVSLHRDIDQGTPNLVTTINKGDYWQAIIAAVSLISGMYDELLTLLTDIKYDYIVTICMSIVDGSIIWTAAEKRYSKGLSMLELVAGDQREEFMKQLYEKTEVAGDPKL